MRGRPPKPKAIKDLTGDLTKGRRPIATGVDLHGTPEPLAESDYMAGPHFRFLAAEFGAAGVLKRADSPALAKLAALWEDFWQARTDKNYKLSVALSKAWDAAAARLCISVADRQKLMLGEVQKTDEIEDRFFKVTG